jgi:hypothetical protein
MSYRLWRGLPDGFLKKSYRYFCKFDPNVQRLIFELAEGQKFKCALCSKRHGLLIEHDHDPDEGPGRTYTIHNVRGLVCHRCNQALRGYEMEERGECTNWENGYPYLSSNDYEDYVYAYKCRVYPLNEAAHETRVGCRNPWRRRPILQKFDEWRYEGGKPPSSWLRFKENESKKIRNPEDALRLLAACMQFVVDQLKKDPDYEPPENFLKLCA